MGLRTSPPGPIGHSQAQHEACDPVNIHQTLSSVFPAGVVNGCSPDEGGSFDVQGLPKGTLPANCEVLAFGHAPPVQGQDHRETYLVQTQDYVLFFDVSAALPGCGYDACIEGGAYAAVAGAQSQDLLAYARRTIASQQH